MSVPIIKVTVLPQPAEKLQVSKGFGYPFVVCSVASGGQNMIHSSHGTEAMAIEMAGKMKRQGFRGIRIIDLSGIPPVEY